MNIFNDHSTLDIDVLVRGRRAPPRGGAVEDGHGVGARLPSDRDDVVVASPVQRNGLF